MALDSKECSELKEIVSSSEGYLGAFLFLKGKRYLLQFSKTHV